MYTIDELLSKMVELDASDMHLTAGAQPTYRISGELVRLEGEPMRPADVKKFVMGFLQKHRKISLKKN